MSGKRVATDNEQHIIHLVDKIQSSELDDIQLPQIVVQGSQSVGKSSALEALSTVGFAHAHLGASILDEQLQEANEENTVSPQVPDTSSESISEGTPVKREALKEESGITKLLTDESNEEPSREELAVYESMREESIASSDDFCDTCYNMTFYFHNEYVGELRTSALAGCATCALLRDAVETFTPDLKDEVTVTMHNGNSAVEISHSTQNEKSKAARDDGNNEDDFTRLTLYRHSLKEDASEKTFKPLQFSEIPSISGDTASPYAMKAFRTWLEECCLQHDLCRAVIPNKLPTRVLDLARLDESDDLRLYTSASEAARYMTLSHCWGDSRVIKLTKARLDAYHKRIQWDSLPKNFQHAIQLTRSLDIRYLWIDSLCIIQDDISDWTSEAEMMFSVYENSYLTIAASKAASPHDGLFTTVGKNHDLQKLELRQDDGSLTDVYIRRKISHFGARHGFPLLSRAWVFQERILSPRVIHFGPQELLWECRESRKCECSFDGILELTHHRVNPKPRYCCLFDGTCPQAHYFSLWIDIVCQYALLRLTYTSDILTALAGLAQKTQQRSKSPYVAGLWLDKYLPLYLLWRSEAQGLDIRGVDETDPLTARPVPRRAPTWSWASIGTPVTYPEFKSFHSFESPIRDVSCSASLINQLTGQPSGFLRMVAPVVSVTLKTIALDDPQINRVQKSQGFSLFKNNCNLSFLSCTLDYDIWQANLDQIHDGSQLYLALICGTLSTYHHKSENCKDSTSSNRDRIKTKWYWLVLRRIDRPASQVDEDAEEEEDDEEGRQESESGEEEDEDEDRKENELAGQYERIGIAEISPLKELEGSSKTDAIKFFGEAVMTLIDIY